MSNAKFDILGWVPIDLGWEAKSSGSSLRQIRWMDCAGVTFVEPFFLQTVSRLASMDEKRQSAVTVSGVIAQRFEHTFEHQPAGIVLHVSRCGSTAVANCMKLCEGAQVVSEYWPLTQILWHRMLSKGARVEQQHRCAESLLINAACWALATCRRGFEERLILKLTSSSLLSIKTIRAVWPRVPLVLIVRNPLEVLTASLSGGGWMAFKGDAEKSMSLIGLPDRPSTLCAAMSDEEFGARVLGNYYRNALRYLADFALVLDHSELSASTIASIVSLFGVSNFSKQAFACELNLNSKARDGPAYVNDATSRQAIASSVARAAVDRFAIEQYAALIAKRSPLALEKLQDIHQPQRYEDTYKQ